MKIVHLSSSDNGGAGIAAYRLHSAMRQKGLDSSLLVLCRKNDDESVQLINTLNAEPSSCQKGMSPHFQVSDLRWQMMMGFHPQRPAGLEMFSDASSDVVLERVKAIQDADIIHLHWVAGLLDYGRLATSFKGKKVVWTLHDMNPFTGGCHYAGSCQSYVTGCESCPQLGANPRFDYAQYIFKQKLRGVEGLDVTVTAPSQWLTECARKSAIFAGKQFVCLPNGISVDVFKPYARESVRNLLGIPQSDTVLLFGAFSVHNQRKGFGLLVDALAKMQPEQLKNTTLVFFGQAPADISLQLPCSVKGVGSISDENSLALIYSMADLFIIPSLEDNLPNTVLESLSCGTPVIGFRIGGIPDMVQHQQTGYLVEPFDTTKLALGIAWCMDNLPQLSREACRQTVKYHFNVEFQAQRYISLYRSLLETASKLQ